MPTLWLTYSWKDNSSGDVDFLAQQVEAPDIRVHLDRWVIGAGGRLWEQIEAGIADPSCSAWAIYATAASLTSEPCREEYAYALDRALRARGAGFPIIAIAPGPVDAELLPAGLRTRLCVSLGDPDWRERVVAAVEGRTPRIMKHALEPYHVHVHHPGRYIIEMRPRAGTWPRFAAAVPMDEADRVESLCHAPAGDWPRMSIGLTPNRGTATFPDGSEWAAWGSLDVATPTESFYLFCMRLPSQLAFGPSGGDSFRITFSNA